MSASQSYEAIKCSFSFLQDFQTMGVLISESQIYRFFLKLRILRLMPRVCRGRCDFYTLKLTREMRSISQNLQQENITSGDCVPFLCRS